MCNHAWFEIENRSCQKKGDSNLRVIQARNKQAYTFYVLDSQVGQATGRSATT